jgi:hypothetical protein
MELLWWIISGVVLVLLIASVIAFVLYRQRRVKPTEPPVHTENLIPPDIELQHAIPQIPVKQTYSLPGTPLTPIDAIPTIYDTPITGEERLGPLISTFAPSSESELKATLV